MQKLITLSKLYKKLADFGLLSNGHGLKQLFQGIVKKEVSLHLLFDWFGLVGCHTTDSKPIKQEVNSTVILLPLVFPDCSYDLCMSN
jgi:hypothetical protein